MKKPGKKTTLLAAVLWTVTSILWALSAMLRFAELEERGVSLLVLTVIAMLASLCAAVANWYRYFRNKEN